jgi:hypothetical protein
MSIKGLKKIQEKSAENEYLSDQNRVKLLFIGDGDAAIIRFINDDEMIQTKIHEYEEIQPSGKKYKKAYCSENLTGAPCKWCAAGNVGKSVYVFLSYVYYILHKNQNPELNKNADAAKWEAATINNQVFYKEDVGEIRLLRMKFGKDGYLKNKVLNFVNEYGTLCDRDYRFSRTGSDKRTLYDFTPKDPSKASKEVVKAAKEALPIEELILGKRNEAAVADENESEGDGKASTGGKTEKLEDLF